MERKDKKYLKEEGGGYPSPAELKKHLKKLKKIRKDLNSGKFNKTKEVPDYMKTPVKKLFTKHLEAGTEKDPDKSILYYHRRVEDIMPDDIFIKLSEDDNTVFMKFPPKYRSKSYERGKDQTKKDTAAAGDVNRDVHGTNRVSDLSFKTPEDALDSIKKVKSAKIDVDGRIKSLLPSLNRLPSTIARTKDPTKRANLLKSLKILQKYYNDIKGTGGNNDEEED